MNIIVATGNLKFNKKVIQSLNDKGYQHVVEKREQEQVFLEIKKNKSDVIILSNIIEKEIPMSDFVRTIRVKFPNTRIVFLLRDDEKDKISFLHEWLIYDVLIGKIKVKELINAIK